MVDRIVVLAQGSPSQAFEIDPTDLTEIWHFDTSNSVHGLALDVLGNSYVCGTNLDKLDAVGGSVFSEAVSTGAGRSIKIDASGNIFVGHGGAAGVRSLSKFDSTGMLLVHIDTGATVFDIDIDAEGNVYFVHGVGTTNNVLKYNNALDTNLLSISTGISIGTQARIFVDSAGKIYVSSGAGPVKRYAANGDFELDISEFFNDGTTPRTPQGLFVDTDGNIYVGWSASDVETCQVKKYNSSGVEQWSYDSISNSAIINDIDIDSDGNVWVAGGNINSARTIAKLDNSSGTELLQGAGPSALLYQRIKASGSLRIIGNGGEAPNKDNMFLVF